MQDLSTIVNKNAMYVVFSSDYPSAVIALLQNNKINFTELTGMYKGEEEESFLVPLDDFGTVIESGLLDGQESILVLGHKTSQGFRKASIVYHPGDEPPVEAGYLVPATRDEAMVEDGWTYDPLYRQYYVLREAKDLVSITMQENRDGH